MKAVELEVGQTEARAVFPRWSAFGPQFMVPTALGSDCVFCIDLQKNVKEDYEESDYGNQTYNPSSR